MTPAARLAAFLEIPEDDAQLVVTLRTYLLARPNLRSVFLLLSTCLTLAESENDEEAQIYIEAALFNVWWVDRFIGHADSFDQCRKKLASILWIFTNECASSYVKDPVLCVWAVVRCLIVERNARAKGMGKWLRSREVEMLDRVIADCQAHRERGLPPDLADRLKILESHGVFFPSDIYCKRCVKPIC